MKFSSLWIATPSSRLFFQFEKKAVEVTGPLLYGAIKRVVGLAWVEALKKTFDDLGRFFCLFIYVQELIATMKDFQSKTEKYFLPKMIEAKKFFEKNLMSFWPSNSAKNRSSAEQRKKLRFVHSSLGITTYSWEDLLILGQNI